jgi:hypothetical protein
VVSPPAPALEENAHIAVARSVLWHESCARRNFSTKNKSAGRRDRSLGTELLSAQL